MLQPDSYDIVPFERQRVVHLTAEYWPFARTGGLAEAVRGLAEYQVRVGQDVAIVMPLYRSVREHTDRLSPVTERFTVPIGDHVENARVYRYTGTDSGVRVFFVENDVHFNREGLYGTEYGDYPDNLRRCAFLCRAALQVLPTLVPNAAILHAHDWHTALSMPYLRYSFAGQPFYDRLGAVLSVHNAAYQGHFPDVALSAVGLPPSMYDWRIMEWYGRMNVLKGGLSFTDLATTVSPTHAAELRTPGGGFGLHDHFIGLGDRFVGVLNGIDYVIWDPGEDREITAQYTVDHLAPKRGCKTALQRAYGLPRRARTPVFVMSARLVEQKGFDLVLEPGLLAQFDAQFIFLGRGDLRYERLLSELASTLPDRVKVPLTFTERLEHRLLAGADLLLMPSQFEPCGLTQMRAQRYGVLPLARRVGGLSDTIADGETGFLFDEYRPTGLARALRRAIVQYQDREAWTALMTKAMRQDFSWGPSASRYQELYHRASARARRQR
ncbi:MAG: glycogen synthase [Gemmatimonadota bacterium]|nr:glycogen synthase [Gemmatimonadota bacterium]MDH3478177.1 glycogen synthase [Gemmatimonadota bacterium]MDH5550087.1 glycogen synthase [Gemmatimonadota bacterium]